VLRFWSFFVLCSKKKTRGFLKKQRLILMVLENKNLNALLGGGWGGLGGLGRGLSSADCQTLRYSKWAQHAGVWAGLATIPQAQGPIS
jgi:hypothetical protein